MFTIHIETCSECGGAVKVIACIEDPVVIEKMPTHLDETPPATEAMQQKRSGCPKAGHRRKRDFSTDVNGTHPSNCCSCAAGVLLA
jgi:hypothetical protein